MVEVRKAKYTDKDQVLSLLKTFPEDPEMPEHSWDQAASAFDSLVEEKGGCIFVAEENQEIVGVITLGYSYVLRFGGVYAMIEEFIISEKMRGRGIANLLIQAAVEEARSRGCPELQVNRPSSQGYPVYIRNGFHEAGVHMKMNL